MSSPPVFNIYDRVRRKFFESSNDRGYLLIPSNGFTPAANRLYSSSVNNDLPTNKPRQVYEVFLF